MLPLSRKTGEKIALEGSADGFVRDMIANCVRNKRANSSMYRAVGFACSRVTRVLWMLEELGEPIASGKVNVYLDRVLSRPAHGRAQAKGAK
jgi:hypothetical protein